MGITTALSSKRVRAWGSCSNTFVSRTKVLRIGVHHRVAETLSGFSGCTTYAPAERKALPLAALFAVVLIAALVFGLALLWLELRHRLRPASPLRLSSSRWKVQRSSANQWQVKGTISIRNPHPRMEVFVPEIEAIPGVI